MTDALRTACRRCGGSVPRVRGPARVYCSPGCRRVRENQLRAVRHDLEAARAQLAHYAQLAAHPLPGMATPKHCRREVARWRARVAEIELDIAMLQQPPSNDARCSP